MGDKNPFSIYDFLGYLFPGVVTLFAILIVRQCIISESDFFDTLHVHSIVQMLKAEKDINWFQASFCIVVAAYVIGHIVAYSSSLSVEYLANKSFGYPSSYLLENSGSSFYKHFFEKSENLYQKVFRWLVALVLWPISSFIFICSEHGLRAFLLNPLTPYIAKAVKTKTFNLYSKLGLEHRSINDEFDFHRVVMHYVYLNKDSAQRKADNYVALYGFLRAMCLIATTFYDVIFFMAIYSIKYVVTSKEWYVNWYIILLVVGFVVCNILFLAFVKFYRRFTLENFMALITMKD